MTEIHANKVAQVTVLFWIIKILATTLGETGGDALSMTMNLGYAASTAIFFTVFVITVSAQVSVRTFRPFLYWAVIVATTTAGTTMADFADRSLGIGYVGGSLILLALLLATLAAWRLSLGSVSVDHIATPKAELFYWATILFSNTLGTALGDFFADDSGLGYDGAALVFAAALTTLAAAYFFTTLSHTLLFWLAFILTRPLGATVGDWLTKPVADGGLHLGRIISSAIIAAAMVALIAVTSRHSGGGGWRGIREVQT
ncbi:hypothetical protein [Pseudorhodoplanes sp.]|uniref:COG4705 family protein n=1 Tax=Pseudorhodoplanes sp. TaxID=1934341 RepID=UPI002CE6CAF4|nr:hypothetical protein [Pseudorhodoplanes sp.]HWV55359.1 hypothetical protein [Pseudorhodoplanes sp.]